MKLSDFFQASILVILIVLNVFWSFLMVVVGVEKITKKQALPVVSQY